MNDEPVAAGGPATPVSQAEPDDDDFDAHRNPIAELKLWFRDLKAHLQGALEEAGEASAEKREAMRADYERRTGRRKE